MNRIRALVGKEFRDLFRNRAALVPVIVVTVIDLVLPFTFALVVPALTGETFATEPDLVKVSAVAGLRGLTTEGQIEYFLFQQFLMLFLLIPVTGAMALAAHAVVGEKQARTLEPILASPVTTLELLIAKVLGALVPTFLITLAGLILFFAGIALFAAPGVTAAMMTGRTAVLVLLIAPAAALVSLQAALVISSRVQDARTAQQFALLIVLPLMGLLVAGFVGKLWLTTGPLAVMGLGLLAVWVLLVMVSVVLFDRESILTRWR